MPTVTLDSRTQRSTSSESRGARAKISDVFWTLVRHLVGENGHVDRDCSTEDAEEEGPKPQQKGHVGGYLSVEVRREHLSLFICKLTVGVEKRPNHPDGTMC